MGDAITVVTVIMYCLPLFVLIDKGRSIYALLGFLFLAMPILLTIYGFLSTEDDSLTHLMLQTIAWLLVGFLALRLPKVTTL